MDKITRFHLIILAASLCSLLVFSTLPSQNPSKKYVSKATIKAYQIWSLKFKGKDAPLLGGLPGKGQFYSTPAEKAFRLEVFSQTVDKISKYNSDYEAQLARAGRKMPKKPMFEPQEMADLTPAEAKIKYTGGVPEVDIQTQSLKQVERAFLSKPNKLDFSKVKLGGEPFEVRIRSQEGCGSCWAFASVLSLEKQFYDQEGIQIDLSQQELINCIPEFGCRGGHMTRVIEYLKEKGNTLAKASAYPYLAAELPCFDIPTSEDQTVKFNALQVNKYLFSEKIFQYMHKKGIIGVIPVFSEKLMHLSGNDEIFEAAFSGECSNTVNHIAALDDLQEGVFRLVNSYGKSWGFKGTKRIKPCSDDNFWGVDSLLYHAYNL